MALKYIAIAGNMGCGKSTLVDFICQTYGAQPFFEPNAKNPYLKDFYADMKKWAFHSQIFFLTHKFRIHQDLDRQRGSKTIIQDRTIYEDAEIFAYHLHKTKLISKRDWEVYEALYKSILDAIQPPDLMIYLRASLKTIQERIRIRNRPEEQNIPVPYIRALNKLYEDWIATYKRSELLVIETDHLDYLNDLVYRIDVLKTIEKIIR
jgi:deoxyadenosine/deoxycytidine kinase